MSITGLSNKEKIQRLNDEADFPKPVALTAVTGIATTAIAVGGSVEALRRVAESFDCDVDNPAIRSWGQQFAVTVPLLSQGEDAAPSSVHQRVISVIMLPSPGPGVCEKRLPFSLSNFSCLEKRVNFVKNQIEEGMKILKLYQKTCRVEYDFNSVELSPRISENEDALTIRIPILYLLEPDDLEPASPCRNLLDILNPESLEYFEIFKVFFENISLAKKAKEFTLLHELAHAACGHTTTRPCDMKESRNREKEADLLAASVSGGAAEGGAYFFNWLAKFGPPPTLTHPLNEDRVIYLQEFMKQEISVH